MKKIKILRIIARLNIGGPAIHTILLTSGLDKDKYDSFLVCGKLGRGEADMGYYAKEKEIEPIFVPELQREISVIKDINAFLKIYRIICRIRPDIIHTHTAKAGSIGRFSGIAHNLSHPFSKKIKLVHTFHGHVLSGYFSKVKSGLFLSIERFLGFFTDAVVTVSGTVKDKLVSLRITGKDKIHIIPLGLELDKFLKIDFPEVVYPDIGIVGRLVPVKNHRLFLDAAAKICNAKEKENVRFSIIGDGPLRKELEGYAAKLGLNQRVDFLGWRRDLEKIYPNLGVVAISSTNEGTPVSLIEAMACKKAVVATDVGGVRDLLGGLEKGFSSCDNSFSVMERGLLVKNLDPESFSKALLFAIDNPALRKKMGEAGRVFVAAKFSRERLFSDIDRLYTSLVQPNNLNLR